MIETITLAEATKLLKYCDIRSAEKWCIRHSVIIFDEGDGKYLIKMQFEYARLKKFIAYLKDKHKDKWLDAFKAYSSLNILSVIEMEEGKTNECPEMISKYKPIGKVEKNFVKVLQNIKGELICK